MNDSEILPFHLAEKSLSVLEIVLQHDDAIEAVNYLAGIGCFIFACEGWIRTTAGRNRHSSQHQGTTEFWGIRGNSVQQRVNEAADFIKRTIRESQQKWDDKPEVVGASLSCLSIEVEKTNFHD